MERHETQQHSQDDLCPKCKKSYPDLLSLNEHLSLCLEDPKKFSCKHCDENISLKKLSYVHTYMVQAAKLGTIHKYVLYVQEMTIKSHFLAINFEGSQ